LQCTKTTWYVAEFIFAVFRKKRDTAKISDNKVNSTPKFYVKNLR